MEYAGGAWSPYLVEALIGVLTMATFHLSDKPLGVSTSYARLAGLLGRLFARRHTDSLEYYQDKKPVIDWEVMLMLVGGSWHMGRALPAAVPAAMGSAGRCNCR